MSDSLQILPFSQDAALDGEPLHLTPAQFRVLALLMGNAGNTYSRAQIIEALYGTPYASTERAVDVVVWHLRKKLGVVADRLQTVRGAGYRYHQPVTCE
jgi:two-component system, OmpR family, alkaline phosphatase synthesis response regulator PhoP